MQTSVNSKFTGLEAKTVHLTQAPNLTSYGCTNLGESIYANIGTEILGITVTESSDGLV